MQISAHHRRHTIWIAKPSCKDLTRPPSTGLASLIYTPENPGESLFQVPLIFDSDGYLLVEKPAGSGSLTRVQGPLVTHPPMHTPSSQKPITGTDRLLDLQIPSAPIHVYGLSTQKLDPYGQKPLGAAWQASTAYLAGEYVQPTTAGGNGHLYRCTTAGTTHAAEPAWPLTETPRLPMATSHGKN